MITKFSVGNFLSFKDTISIDFTAEALKEQKEYLHTPFFFNSDLKLLKSIGIYGHNSHGKSNLLKAYSFFRNLIFTSFKENKSGFDIPIFGLNTSNVNKPTTFEITFIIKDVKYRYGFEINKDKVVSEWLFNTLPKIKENYLFIRNGQEFNISKTWNKEEDNKVEKQARPFALEPILLLSVLLSLKLTRILPIENWLGHNLIISSNDFISLLDTAAAIYSKEEYRALILKFLRIADLGFTSIFDKIEKRKEINPTWNEMFLNDVSASAIRDFKLYTGHDIYSDDYSKIVEHIEFELVKNESSGSIKYFTIACFLSYAIKNSQLIWIDELDASLHTGLLSVMVQAYNEDSVNQTGSQLVFTTHNTVLLDKKLRRDQFMVMNKNDYGESSLAKLYTSDNPIRKDKSMEKEYRRGDYGGISKKLKDKDKNSGPTLFDDLNIE